MRSWRSPLSLNCGTRETENTFSSPLASMSMTRRKAFPGRPDHARTLIVDHHRGSRFLGEPPLCSACHLFVPVRSPCRRSATTKVVTNHLLFPTSKISENCPCPGTVTKTHLIDRFGFRLFAYHRKSHGLAHTKHTHLPLRICDASLHDLSRAQTRRGPTQDPEPRG